MKNNSLSTNICAHCHKRNPPTTCVSRGKALGAIAARLDASALRVMEGWSTRWVRPETVVADNRAVARQLGEAGTQSSPSSVCIRQSIFLEDFPEEASFTIHHAHPLGGDEVEEKFLRRQTKLGLCRVSFSDGGHILAPVRCSAVIVQ